MSESRKYPRTPMKCQVKVTHPSIGEVLVNTRDISDGGIFLITKGFDMPAIGEVVQGQVQNMGVEAPVLKLQIVRLEDEGMGLKFVSDK